MLRSFLFVVAVPILGHQGNALAEKRLLTGECLCKKGSYGSETLHDFKVTECVAIGNTPQDFDRICSVLKDTCRSKWSKACTATWRGNIFNSNNHCTGYDIHC